MFSGCVAAVVFSGVCQSIMLFVTLQQFEWLYIFMIELVITSWSFNRSIVFQP